MNSVALIFIVALIAAGCSQHTEIGRPVTAQEVAGRWMLTMNAIKSLANEGFTAQQGEEIFITIHTNGSYSCHTILLRWDGQKYAVNRSDEQGRWVVSYNPKGLFKNQLVLHASADWVSSLWVALDSGKIVLWKSWGDPDDGIELVYEKMRDE